MPTCLPPHDISNYSERQLGSIEIGTAGTELARLVSAGFIEIVPNGNRALAKVTREGFAVVILRRVALQHGPRPATLPQDEAGAP